MLVIETFLVQPLDDMSPLASSHGLRSQSGKRL